MPEPDIAGPVESVQPIESAEPSNPEPPVDQIVEPLLAAAAAAMKKNYLTTPQGEDALSMYHQVLVIDPDNAPAREGINSIVEQYLAWALDYAERPDLKKARQYLLLAETIDPTHPNIESVINKINDQADIDVTVFSLVTADVLARQVAPDVLDRLARLIEQQQAFVTIRAPDDPSGRWLYQELIQRVNLRIKASFEQSRQTSVSLSPERR